jgi:hypothetical protein
MRFWRQQFRGSGWMELGIMLVRGGERLRKVGLEAEPAVMATLRSQLRRLEREASDASLGVKAAGTGIEGEGWGYVEVGKSRV